MFAKDRMKPVFRQLKGGLFDEIQKADVGNAAKLMMQNGVDMFCWADPFFPDRIIPEHIQNAVKSTYDTGVAEHYTTPIGNSVLKDAIKKKLSEKNGLNVDSERNIIITPGSDSGLFFALLPFIEPGDEVLIVDPSYPNNFQAVQLLGGIPVSVPVKESDGYELNINEFEKRISEKTKLVLLTNPNNPTTVVYSKKSMDGLADFVRKNDLMILVDQAFEDIVFDGKEMITMASLDDMWPRTVTLFSISKGMGLSGFRVGYIVASDEIMDVLYASAVSVIGATNSSAQAGAIAACEDSSFIDEYRKIFDSRRRRVYEYLSDIPGVRMEMPQSSFLSWVNISKLGTSQDMVQYLVEEANIFVNAGSFYGKQGEGYIRIVQGCYGDDQRLTNSLERLRAALIKKSKTIYKK